MLWCVVGMATNERKSVVLQLFAHFCLGAEINLRIFSKQEHQAPTQHRTSQQRELCGDGETKHAKGWERPRAHTHTLSPCWSHTTSQVVGMGAGPTHTLSLSLLESHNIASGWDGCRTNSLSLSLSLLESHNIASGWDGCRTNSLSLSLPVGVTQHRKWLGWVQDQLTNCFIASLILVMAAGQPRRHPAASTGAHSPTNTASRCPSGLAQAVLCGCYGRLLCVGPTA
jgi:hypothetical protein